MVDGLRLHARVSTIGLLRPRTSFGCVAAPGPRPPLLTARCDTCRVTQPYAPNRDKGGQRTSPPYRCFNCGQVVANPVIRLRSRRAAE